MRILLLGKDGQVGWELHRLLGSPHQVIGLGREGIELTRLEGIRDLVERSKPQVVINAAAYNAVDRAESEVDAAEAVNAIAPGILAAEAARRRAVFIHYSTDYVFDGLAGRAYREDDPPNPVNAYGRSKLLGEQAVQNRGGVFLVLRTSWVYSLRRASFVTQVLAWSRSKAEVRVADDQTSSPTWCRVVAQATAEILAGAGPEPWSSLAARSGVYHLTCGGAATRYEWARAILELDPQAAEQHVHADDLLPGLRSDFPSPAARPAYTALDSSRICQVFGLTLPKWKDALRQAFNAP